MDKKWKLSIGIVLIILVASISGYFLISTNGQNNPTNKTYFAIDGTVQVWNGGTFENINVPMHLLTTQNISFTYVPYYNNTPQTGFIAVIPEGVDTSKTFMLNVPRLGPNVTGFDILVHPENSNIILQKIHVDVPTNVTVDQSNYQ